MYLKEGESSYHCYNSITMEKDLVGRYVKYNGKRPDIWTIPEPKAGTYHLIRGNFGRVGDGWYLGVCAIQPSDFTLGSFELMPKGFFPSHAKKAEMFPIY